MTNDQAQNGSATVLNPHAQELLDLLQNEKSLKRFRDMFESSADLEEFARRAQFASYDLAGYQITSQGEEAGHFFLIMSGQLRALDISTRKLLNYMIRGDFFGTRALLGDRRRTATVETVTQAKIAVFNENDWRWLLNKNAGFRTLFEEMENQRISQSAIDFPGRQPDEVVVISTKRHFVAFLAKLPLPLALLIAPILFFLGAELLGIRFLEVIVDTLSLIATLPFFIVATLLTVYHYFDWRNDDLIVTTKRVIHIERILFYGEQRRDAPLTRVEDVLTLSDIFDYIFDSDSLIITTAGAGKIAIDHIRRAPEVRGAILEQAKFAKQRFAEADVSALQRNMAKNLGLQDELPKNTLPVAEPEWNEDGQQSTTHHYSGVVDYFIPRVKEIDKQGNSTVITWRKHRFVLLVNILKPTFALIILFYLFLVVALPLLQVLIGLGILASFFWYLWEYDDWRRDLYQVTDTHIIDIDSAAFRLRKSRRDGSFDKIQNVYTEVPNLFYKLLNMGNVIIETAGSEGRFTFRKVYNPTAVNKEIFNRWAIYQQRQHERQRDTTNQEVMEILKEYHRITTRFANRPQTSATD